MTILHVLIVYRSRLETESRSNWVQSVFCCNEKPERKGFQGAPKTGFSFEARLDAPDGKMLGKGSLPAPQRGNNWV